jgi:holo-[acyl-carrier-protein] synthase
MISGIGIDIVEIRRIEEAAARWGDRFLNRIFSPEEIAYCYAKKDPFPHLAARFAAKEAAVKALSSLFRGQEPLVITDIAVSNDREGRPSLSLRHRELPMEKPWNLHLSLTHERSHAVAVVVLERGEG